MSLITTGCLTALKLSFPNKRKKTFWNTSLARRKTFQLQICIRLFKIGPRTTKESL